MNKFPLIFILILSSCLQNKYSNSESAEVSTLDNNKIVLTQVEHPYLGGHISDFLLDDDENDNFIKDFNDNKREFVKFYSCYVIKFYDKNGSIKSYRTNGKYFESLNDTLIKGQFRFNSADNLITKYWKISLDRFCEKPNLSNLIKGKWYQNIWTNYHTLDFSNESVFVDNNIDSVFTINYKIKKDTLNLFDTSKKINTNSKIILLTNDTLVIKGFLENKDTIKFSRKKREWKNE